MDVTDRSDTPATVEIVSEPRGGHWVAWVATGADRKPANATILVGQTREEAEARARAWANSR